MMVPTLAVWYVSLMAVLFVVVCAFMILLVLIQKSRGGGLAGAFGGAASSAQAAFGAKTGDVLTWVTVTSFVLFILLAMGLTWSIVPESQRVQEMAPSAPTAPASPEQAGTSDATTQPAAPATQPASAVGE
ncbi:MAG: preprotein translocase subunit SecG [Phycisphaeraceae bacterium]|nr:preprotein translocase subunit SecG [Phycisphaeraceae bacterium]